MKKILIYLSCTLSLLFWSCHDTGPVLSGCCSTPGLYGEVGNGFIWIPNIFTPNGDGINDQLWVYGDSIERIVKFVITDRNEKSVFLRANVFIDDTSSAWDGSVFGEVEKGVYSIQIKVEAKDGTISSFTGQVCNFICDESDDHNSLEPIECLFGHHIYDFLYTHGAVEYQENLPCLN